MITLDGTNGPITDLMNPEDMFKDGKRLREWSAKDILPTSAKLIPEFDRRRSIREMFIKIPSVKKDSTPSLPNPATTAASPSSASYPLNIKSSTEDTSFTLSQSPATLQIPTALSPNSAPDSSQTTTTFKRSVEPPASSSRPLKRSKAASSKGNTAKVLGASQKTLKGFFEPKTPIAAPQRNLDLENTDGANDSAISRTCSSLPIHSQTPEKALPSNDRPAQEDRVEDPTSGLKSNDAQPEKFIDPIVSKESWSKLLGKRIIPKCEHGDECQTLVTKKPGINRGMLSVPSPWSFSVLSCPL